MDKENVSGYAPRDILGQDADQLGHYKNFDFYSKWDRSPGRVLSIDLLFAFNKITLAAVLKQREGEWE